MVEIAGKKVIVLGLAKSGLAAVQFLIDQGARVFATDSKSFEEIARIEKIADLEGVELFLGTHPANILTEADLMVISPGISEKIPFVTEAKKCNLPIISELELATSHINKPLIAVSGTNGKTTTTTLLGKLLEAGGAQVVVCGNIGKPVSGLVEKINQVEAGVLEVSSFQLERSPSFKPRGALILNITPDHQDRYDSFADYEAAKAMIFANQASSDWAILNYDDPACRSMQKPGDGKLYHFSRTDPVERGTFIRDGKIIFKSADGIEEEVLPVNDIALEGLHNRENFLAATLAAILWGVKPQAIQQVAKTFKGLPHRLETVATISGVRFINDSKGTNVDAVRKSLQGFTNQSVVLIMGGRDKGGNFSELEELVSDKVKGLILIGEASARLAATFGSICCVKKADSLEEAVNFAAAAATENDVVLLSPGCTSWDMFSSYEERGATFKKAVRELQR